MLLSITIIFQSQIIQVWSHGSRFVSTGSKSRYTELLLLYVSNPWIFTENLYLSTPPTSVFNSIQPWRHKFHSAGCWKISALLDNQRVADFPASCWFSSNFPTLFQQFLVSSPSASTRVFQLWTLVKQVRVLLAEGSSCGCVINCLEVRGRS